MKTHLIIPLALLTSLALLGVIKIRKKENEKVEKHYVLQNIKLRVNDDALDEYRNSIAEDQNLLEKTKSEHNTIQEELDKLKLNEDRVKNEADLCQESKKSEADKLAVITMDLNNLKAETEKEMTLWNTEIAALKEQAAGRSSVCDFLKGGMPFARHICGNKEPNRAKEEGVEVPKKEEAKADAPKQDPPKEDAPKQEPPKADAPKQDPPKADAPKQEPLKNRGQKEEEVKVEVHENKKPKTKEEAQR
ncbi:uncharacterized protein LOC121642012 [Melanotaenia boesemani]|uniref:uncharacterized protein LOC121642012 n=1 Tax=Melanotaenia boesemani TaxID=1250792 RepID=UPI001C053294|nr:uncharacterized protein LOC121642012 [Melanotaenia boesemani]